MLQILLTLLGNVALFLSERKRNEHFVVAKYKLGRNLPSDPPLILL